MRRVRSMGAALAAMFVLGAVTAAGAWAAGEGPGWHVHLAWIHRIDGWVLSGGVSK